MQEFGRIVFLGLAIAIFFYELHQIVAGRSSKGWRKHRAKVIDVKIDTITNEGADEYSPCIRYEYYYLGALYKGKKVKFGGRLRSTNYAEASKVVSGIVSGSAIDVYVNPKNPRQSVLYRGYEGSSILNLILVGVLLYAALKS